MEAWLSPFLSANSLSLNKAVSDNAKLVLFFAICLCGNYVVTLECQTYHKLMPRKVDNLEEKFWGKVNKSADCWLWTGGIYATGYGYICIGSGKAIGAHRFSYELHNAPIPSGMYVCHRCDNRLCVNPAHLFLGSHVDNVKDMVAKGRHANQIKSHCPSGHAYDAENTYTNKLGQRWCRTCKQARRARSRQKAQDLGS